MWHEEKLKSVIHLCEIRLGFILKKTYNEKNAASLTFFVITFEVKLLSSKKLFEVKQLSSLVKWLLCLGTVYLASARSDVNGFRRLFPALYS